MNRHLLLAIIFLAIGFILICLTYFSSSYRLVIRGTHISFGWFLIILGVIRLLLFRFQKK